MPFLYVKYSYLGMKSIILLIVPGLIIITSCNRVKDDDQLVRHWYKGNLNTHSYWSDGDDFPEMIMDWYKNHGYHFVSLSDHNILAEANPFGLSGLRCSTLRCA